MGSASILGLDVEGGMMIRGRIVGGRILFALILTGAFATTGFGLMNASAESRGAAVHLTTHSSRCSGKPIILMTIGSFTPGVPTALPDIEYGANAATVAVNKTCEDGRPIRLIACNNNSTAAGDTACGQEAIADHVVAVVGAYGTNSDGYNAILQAAGIPIVAQFANGSLDTSDSLSFPIDTATGQIIGFDATAADVGAKKVVFVGLNLPAVTFFDSVAQSLLPSLHLQFAGQILAPFSVSDMTPYAADAVSTGADAIFLILASSQDLSFLTALHNQGISLNKIHVITSASEITPGILQQWGSVANGMDLVSGVWPTSNTSQAGIAKYLAELRADHYSTTGALNVGETGVVAWASVHIVADLLKGAKNFTSATLVKRIHAAGPNFYKTEPALPPWNWDKLAFASNPLISNLRLFTSKISIVAVKNAKYVPLTNGFVSVNHKVNILKVSGL